MEISTIPERINREKIPLLQFKTLEVIDDTDLCLQRKLSLQRAAQMSHSFYSKVRIVFQTEEGKMEVLTTVWAVTDKFVILKGGISIPVCAICEVALPQQ